MSKTNCFLPNSGFVLNLRVRTVNSLIVKVALGGRGEGTTCSTQDRAEVA